MLDKGKGKRKGKVEMRRMENPIRRQITFSKRKAGLLKKASELSLLCDIDLALIISSPSGKLYHSTAPNIDRALERYQEIYASSNYFGEDSEDIEPLQLEVEKGKKIETKLKMIQNHMNGEDLNCLTFKELENLEQQLEIGATKICSLKERLHQNHITSLKIKLKMREVETHQNDLEGATNGRVDDHNQPYQIDGDANGVARARRNLQCHTNLSLSLP